MASKRKNKKKYVYSKYRHGVYSKKPKKELQISKQLLKDMGFMAWDINPDDWYHSRLPDLKISLPITPMTLVMFAYAAGERRGRYAIKDAVRQLIEKV